MARCVCKKSNTFPICDGSHRHNGWNCSDNNKTFVEKCIMTSPNYYPLAEGLSSTLHLPIVHRSKTNLKSDICYVISDGIDWDDIRIQLQRVEAEHWILFSINRDPTILMTTFKQILPHISLEGRQIPDTESLYTNILQQINHTKTQVQPQMDAMIPVRVFVSHAVKDEEILHRCLQQLRSFPIEFFVCSSSITNGGNWYEEIMQGLETCDVFLYIHSTNSHNSTFCAFECGIARTLEKKIAIIALEPPPLPAYLQHIQALDIQRLQNEKPWLSRDECIREAFFQSIFFENSIPHTQ